jgi:CheY-like chemotaxis protein
MASILVVEDDAQFRRFLVEVLEDAGYAVNVAGGGAAALAQLASQPVDVVLTDLVMPGQDGISLIRVLRKTRPDLPIIAMSGRGRTGLHMDSLELVRLLGADGTLQKPFTAEVLETALRQVLSRH